MTQRALSPIQRALSLTIVTCGALAILVSCITVNVYFPAKELQAVAEEIVNEVRPELTVDAEPSATDSTIPSAARRTAENTAHVISRRTSARLTAGALPESLVLLSIAASLPSLPTPLGNLTPRGRAQSAKDIAIDVSSPKIKKVKETLKKRYAKLIPFYSNGRVGESWNGRLVARSLVGLKLKEKRALTKLVKAENLDRDNLYFAIAEANRIDKKQIARIGALFSVEWQKKCKIGWWIEPTKGKWKKKVPKKKKKAKKPAAARDE